MGASEILQILEKGERLTCFEIAQKTECSIGAVKHTIQRLMKDMSEKLECRLLTQEEKENKYGHKIGCKVHIYWVNE